MTVIKLADLGKEIKNICDKSAKSNAELIAYEAKTFSLNCLNRAKDTIHKYLNKRSGALGKSFSRVTMRRKNFYASGLRNKMAYARSQEYGSDPHIIRAKNKPFLVFKHKGHLVQKKSVNHPGTKATHFMSTPIRETAVDLLARLKKGIGLK